MEVNKVASWEDVLTDNYNSAAFIEQEQQQEAVVAENETIVNTVDASGEPVAPVAEVETQVEEQPEVQENVQQDDSQDDDDEQYQTEAQQEFEQASLADLDEDTIYEYLSMKKTNYDEVSDIDILAGFISSENPKWDSEDIEFELEQKYGSALFEDKIDLEEIDQELYPDEYKEAVKINKEIDRAQKFLKRDAIEKRAELEELKQNIQLPKSERKISDNNVSDSQAEQAQQKQDEAELQRLQQQWIASVEKDVPSVSEFKFNLGDEEVSYKVTQDEQAQLVQTMKEFNAESYLVNRGWVNQDGTPNVKKITEDVYLLENSEKMFKSGWTQAKEMAKMDIIGKDIKNINLGSPNTTFDAKGGTPHDFGNYVLGL